MYSCKGQSHAHFERLALSPKFNGTLWYIDPKRGSQAEPGTYRYRPDRHHCGLQKPGDNLPSQPHPLTLLFFPISHSSPLASPPKISLAPYSHGIPESTQIQNIDPHSLTYPLKHTHTQLCAWLTFPSLIIPCTT